jgi:hypothetical protein
MGLVNGQALGLAVGTFIPVYSQPLQPFQDDLD